jgi:CubicO group peptidase (beta-lactamase class C family)
LTILCAVGLTAAATAGENSTAGYAGETVVKGELGTRLDEYMQRLADFGFSGSLLVAKDSEVVLAKGYGLADREKRLPYTPQTVFSIGSITKQFTAAAILKLQMQGKLNVRDSISKYLPNVPEDKSAITLHHLLTHSAGLESDFGPSDFEAVTRDEIIKQALASKLRSAPGKQYHYSNAGYSLLGAIVEIVSGGGYEAFLHEHLFKPAGMTQTGYRLPKWSPDRLAQGYGRGGQRWGTILERPWAADGPYWNLRANGGIHSTLADMYRWHRALEGEAILSKDAKEQLFARHIPEGAGEESFYGYGWAIWTTRRGTNLIAHNGGNGIFAADFRRYVDDRVVVMISSNNAEASAIRVSDWIDCVVFGGEHPVPPKVIRLSATLLARYAGTYQLPSGDKVVVAVKDGTLRMTPQGAQALALLMSGKLGVADRLKALSQRTEAIAAAQLKRDYGPLHKAFGGRLPLDRIQAIETSNRRSLEENHGTIQSFEVLGSVAAEQGAETYVRLQCQRGTAVVCYAWQGEQLRGIRLLPALPTSRTFLPESETAFASFSFATPTPIRIEFVLQKDGRVTGLAVPLGSGKVVAKKA